MAGVSLIEVLVTMVVVSVGLLGVAALQLKALKNTYASFQRSLATLQAQDLADRLWANTCIFGDAGKLSSLNASPPSVLKEWADFHSNSAATQLAMPSWDGTTNTVLSYNTSSKSLTATITISWKDVMVNQGQIAGGDDQSLTQYVSIPTVTCN